jgi:hypothetical protein
MPLRPEDVTESKEKKEPDQNKKHIKLSHLFIIFIL